MNDVIWRALLRPSKLLKNFKTFQPEDIIRALNVSLAYRDLRKPSLVLKQPKLINLAAENEI